MSLRLGDMAPDFTAETTQGTIRFHEWLGHSWGIFFSHPGDFTPVCTTELGAVARIKQEFDKRNVKPIAISVDPLDAHKKWVCDIEETQSVQMNYPVIADPDRKIAEAYDMIHPNADSNATVRSVFIIDPEKKIRLTLTYPASTGRNFAELLRVIDSMQLTDNYQVATPADWTEGRDVVILPSIPSGEARGKFPKGFKELRPYLRMTPQPDK